MLLSRVVFLIKKGVFPKFHRSNQIQRKVIMKYKSFKKNSLLKLAGSITPLIVVLSPDEVEDEAFNCCHHIFILLIIHLLKTEFLGAHISYIFTVFY